ncbi:hypothetical protein I6F11_04260 [Ensifer sp. NBAIM29]|nr:hypothetical protein [Ensifer sp. NBAIM29]
MSISRDSLRNALAILMSIDRHDLDRAGYSPTDAEWAMFESNPHNFYLRASTDRQETIFNAIKARMQGSE